MFNSTVLDVAIGLVVVYFILAIACSTITEAISKFFNWRAETLWLAVKGLFQNGTAAERVECLQFATDLYNHDLIDALSPDRDGAKPSYVPAHLFSLALVDQLGLNAPAGAGAAPQTIDARLQGGDAGAAVKKALKPLAIAAGTNLDQFRLNVESWFDAAMQRASGWYKRRTQVVIFYIAFAAVLVSNADTFMITNTLWSNPAARAALVDSGRGIAAGSGPSATAPGGAAAKTGPSGSDKTPAVDAAPAWAAPEIEKAKSQVDTLLGWSGTVQQKAYLAPGNDVHEFPHSGGAWLYKLAGLLVTSYAVTLGAPFWFDVLKKFVNVRGSGASPTDKPLQGAPASAQRRIPSSPTEAG